MKTLPRALVVLLGLCAALLPLPAGDGPGAAVGVAWAETASDDHSCVCEEDGYGACQHSLRSPGAVTEDPCWCPKCQFEGEHDGGKLLREHWNPQCMGSGRLDCYLKRHSDVWQITCSECLAKTDCCKYPKGENCPDCLTGETSPLATDVFGNPARETVMKRLERERQFFKKSKDVIVLYNRRFYMVSDIGGVKVRTRGGSARVVGNHEYIHLMLERAEYARREFVQHLGDRLLITKPVGIFMADRERDAQAIQATYFRNPRTNQIYGGSNDTSVADGFCFNGFSVYGQKHAPDHDLHMAMRHMLGHSLISCWVVVDGNNRALPRWLFEGMGHWLCKLQPRFRDDVTYCADEGTPISGSGKSWANEASKLAGDRKLISIEQLFGKTAIGHLDLDDHRRAWSYLDLCLSEWREPFVEMLADLRRQKELRDAFMQHLQVTPEIFDERWRERVTGRRRSMSPKANEDEPEENDTPGARERRGLRNESDLAALAARIRGLGTVSDPKTIQVLVDLLPKNSELVRESITVAFMKTTSIEVQEALWQYGLDHKDPVARAYTARACGKLGLEYALLKLRAQLDDAHWFARAEAAVACGLLKDANAMSRLREMVNGDPAEKTQLAAMDALAMFGPDAQMSVPLVARQLDSSQWQLRVAAAQALGAIEQMEAVEPLITRMEQETGRVREEIRDALRKITYDDFRKPEHWRKWWEQQKAQNGGRVPDRPKPPAPEAKQPDRKDPDDRYAQQEYYGIEIYSSRIGFVLDTSLSMDQNFAPAPAAARMLGNRDYTGKTKLVICKEEIAYGLKSLDPRAHFNVIAFNTRVRPFKKNPIPASPGNVSSGISWIANLPPEGETNYYGALRAALDLDEGPDTTPNFRSTPDTLTFLTDGMPTQGEITDSDTLLEWYTSLNRYARVKTHVIAFGNTGVDLELLRGMAERNAGHFVHVPEKR